MKEVIIEIQKLYDAVVAKDKFLDNEIARLTAQKESQEKVGVEQNLTKKELTAREAKVSNVENLIVLNTENKTLLRKAEEAREKLAKENSAFNIHIENEKKDIQERKKELLIVEERLKKDRAELKESLINEIFSGSMKRDLLK